MNKPTWHQRLISRVARMFHRLYALLWGYFWLPCPICGKMFGGHESIAGLMTSWDEGKSVCPNCAEEAKRRNKEFMSQNPAPIRYQIQYQRSNQ